jgi:hypothetical protein
MSLEDMSRKARRKNNKQDKANPGARKQKSIDNVKRIQRQEAASSLSAAQERANKVPPIKEVGKGLDGGDAPEEVANDNGRGTHMEQPLLACTGTISNHEGDRPCRAKFHTQAKHANHMTEVHPENPVPNPTLFKD